MKKMLTLEFGVLSEMIFGMRNILWFQNEMPISFAYQCIAQFGSTLIRFAVLLRQC